MVMAQLINFTRFLIILALISGTIRRTRAQRGKICLVFVGGGYRMVFGLVVVTW